MTDAVTRLQAAGIEHAVIQVRALNRRLADPTPEARSLLATLGVDGESVEEKMRQLRSRMPRFTPQQRSELLFTIVGVDALRAALVLTAPEPCPYCATPDSGCPVHRDGDG